MVGHLFDPQGEYIVLDVFHDTIMAYCIDETKLYYEDGKNDPNIEKPDKVLHRKLLAW